MILGMTPLTFIHVLLSLVGIATGILVVFQMIGGKRLGGLNTIFLATTILTSVTGYFFPITKVTPGIIIGAISLVVLAVAILARYAMHLAGAWRWIYVVCAAVALYFNVFVLIVQAFMKVPALKALAPTQKEPPFLVVQLFVLALFIGLTILAAKRFRIGSVQTA